VRLKMLVRPILRVFVSRNSDQEARKARPGPVKAPTIAAVSMLSLLAETLLDRLHCPPDWRHKP
jgi:hypothetical protein